MTRLAAIVGKALPAGLRRVLLAGRRSARPPIALAPLVALASLAALPSAGGSADAATTGLRVGLATGRPGVEPGDVHRPRMAIRGVALVDVRSGRTVRDRTILIEGDRIARVGPTDEVEIGDAALVIEGAGLFAVPGLTDLHVHMEADDLPLFLANGITTVREMNGSAETLALREEVRAGRLTGPTIYAAGPLLAGAPQPWDHVLVESPEQARREVLREAEAGFDFVKVYDGLPADAYRAIVETATERGLPVLGHVPEDVGLEWAMRHEQRTIEHVEQIVRATVGHDLERNRIPAIARAIADGGSAVTPTLAALEILSARRSAWFDGLFGRAEMRFTPPGVRDWWESLRQPVAARAGLSDSIPGGTSDWIDFQRALTRALAEADVALLVGTDTPNPLLVPGFSIHQELEALVRAGLDPAAVLRAATLGAAVHLEAEDEFGELRPGLRADVVLLEGDPFEDLSNLRRPRGLVLRGAWLDRDRLDAWLEEVARRRAP